MRKLGQKDQGSYETYRKFLETRPADVCANILVCLIHQTIHLLDQLLRQLDEPFSNEGGLRERMSHPLGSSEETIGPNDLDDLSKRARARCQARCF